METLTILAVGDMHLGTVPSQLPSDLQDSGISPHDLSPAAAWATAVDCAIQHKIDAVLLAGDVVESTNARFEAMVPLEQGVNRLIENNIKVIAVAGNHDTEALPRLARLIDGFCLLGENGQWEKTILSKQDGPAAAIVGWSFPERHVRDNPVAKLDADSLDLTSTTLCKIGLLHGDLDASGGRYAPIRTSELISSGFDAWLLGHIHKPSLSQITDSSANNIIGYLGSLVGLDPTEAGPHGPWMLKISATGIDEIKHIPLAPLRWEHVEIPIDSIASAEDLPDLLLDHAVRIAREIEQEGLAPQVLGIRAKLTSQCVCHKEIQEWVDKRQFERIRRTVDRTLIFYNKVINLSDMPIDIEKIAAGDDPAALLAQRILLLENQDPAAIELIDQARNDFEALARENVWIPVDDHRNAEEVLSEEYLRALLIRSGKAALHGMLEQMSELET